MPEEGIPLRDKAEFMTSEEVIQIASSFVEMGVTKIRLTGGEPLIKKDIGNILLQLGQLPIELTLTTNGIMVDRYLDTFLQAGIKSINVSLDSLQGNRMKAISRRDYFNRIMSNIDLLLSSTIEVKINVVLMRGVNDDEIIDFINFTKNRKVAVRFIEFMPFSGNKWDQSRTISLAEIMDLANGNFLGIQKLDSEINSTSINYRISGFKGSFGVISTVTNPFCDACNRIRLTADGKLKNCLFSSDEADLLTNLRNGYSIEDIALNAIQRKNKQLAGIDSFHTVKGETIFSKNRSMISIGG